MNKVILMGNLTRNPQQRSLPGGTAVCGFGLAVHRKYRGQDGEKKEETCFVDVDAFLKPRHDAPSPTAAFLEVFFQIRSEPFPSTEGNVHVASQESNRARESLRRYSDERHRLTVEVHCFPDHRGVTAKAALPVAVIQDNNRGSPKVALLR